MSTITAPARSAQRLEQRKRILTTPEGLSLPLTIGSRGGRAAALILDFLILYFGTVIFAIALWWIASELGVQETAGDLGAGEFLFIMLIVMLFLAWNGYFMVFELGPRAATPGKRALGLRVASRDGGHLTPEAVIARNLLRNIELFMPLTLLIDAPTGEAGLAGMAGAAWFMVFALFPFFNRDSLRAGDIVAGTWVVNAPRSKLAETLSTEGAGVAGSSTLTGANYLFEQEDMSIYGEYELQTLERVLRNDNPKTIVAVADTICRKIGWSPGQGDERAFLEAFYTQLRAKLEQDLRFGQRKADKFS